MSGLPGLRAERSETAALKIPRTKYGNAARLVTIFGSLGPRSETRAHYIFDSGAPDYLQLVRPADEALPSLTRQTPAAAWYERELRDQYGVEIGGHPDPRPLLFHENWPDGLHPMTGPLDAVPWSSGEYPFLEVQGEGIAEVAVGPVHAGIIEPGHFRFSVVGDTILHLELRHFYTHKGTERLFFGKCPADGALLAESVSGDNCFAHAVCFSQAVENAGGAEPPPRAAALRMLGLELERLACHISDVGGLCTDVGFGVGAAYASRLKESLLQACTQCSGTRYLRGLAVPGGLRFDIGDRQVGALAQMATEVHREFAEMARHILDTPSIQNRFEAAGILRPAVARELAVVGPVARASGVDLDVRRDHPYAQYARYPFEVPVTHYGDVMARARIRITEAAGSAALIDRISKAMPGGAVIAPLDLPASSQGFSAVESPRGELCYWLQADEGRLTRCHIKSPSFQNWPALPIAVAGNVIADFPLINKSFNLSYSGCDR